LPQPLAVPLRPAIFLLLALLWAAVAHPQTLALTFDDGLNPDTEPHAQAWNSGLLEALRAEAIPAMLFPATSRVGGIGGQRLVAAWSAAGHPVGNHTSRHRNLGSSRVSLAEFIGDVEEADRAFNHLPTWVRLLRFPFLKEGDTAEKRNGMREWMRANGYRPAPVTIDTSDWYYNRVWLELQARGHSAKLPQLQREYIEHLVGRAKYYDELAKATIGRSPPHVMLLHVNAINAASLPAVARRFKSEGWRFIAPLQAFVDDVYAMAPQSLPAGESLIWALAKDKGTAGLRYPAEDGTYEEPLLRAKGLLAE